MVYRKRIVRCTAIGMTREAARQSLSTSDKFPEGIEILELNRKGDIWVASILEPVTADFPFNDEGNDKSESDTPKDEGSEGPSKDDPEGDSPDSPSDKNSDSDGEKSDDKPKSEKAELGELVALVHQIIDHLGIGADPAMPGAEDVPLPGLDGPPPPGGPGPDAGPPPHDAPGPQVVMHKTKLKPGDVAPGQLPIGAPAFSSTDLSRMASFDAVDDTPNKSIKQAKAELDEEFGPMGFKVRQIKRVEGGTKIAAKLSRR